MPSHISRKELIRKFKALGYSGPFSGTKHQFMKKDKKKIRIPNPHKSGDVHISLVKEILRQAGISGNEWDSAFRKSLKSKGFVLYIFPEFSAFPISLQTIQ